MSEQDVEDGTLPSVDGNAAPAGASVAAASVDGDAALVDGDAAPDAAPVDGDAAPAGASVDGDPYVPAFPPETFSAADGTGYRIKERCYSWSVCVCVYSAPVDSIL